MLDTITLVIAWIFVLVFAITLFFALLDLAGIFKIEDPARRTWLFGTLIASVVMPVVKFGGNIFDSVVTSSRPTEVAKPQASGVVPTSRPTEPLDQDATTDAKEDAPVLPLAVSTWVSANMPPRPAIAAGFATEYPTCIAHLRTGDPSDTATSEAAQCRGELERHKSKYISGYYSVKENYDAAIKDRQADLSRRGLTATETEIYNYLQSENEDLNYREGASLRAIVTAESRINSDIEFCRDLQ